MKKTSKEDQRRFAILKSIKDPLEKATLSSMWWGTGFMRVHRRKNAKRD